MLILLRTRFLDRQRGVAHTGFQCTAAGYVLSGVLSVQYRKGGIYAGSFEIVCGFVDPVAKQDEEARGWLLSSFTLAI